MDDIKEFNFNVNGFDIKSSYSQKTINKTFIPMLKKWTKMSKKKDERFIIF
ncbi:hypothetical protein [Clostridium saccharobutylicum]|nr:hypothetical protein [Clostridium saccharobutylicum]